MSDWILFGEIFDKIKCSKTHNHIFNEPVQAIIDQFKRLTSWQLGRCLFETAPSLFNQWRFTFKKKKTAIQSTQERATQLRIVPKSYSKTLKQQNAPLHHQVLPIAPTPASPQLPPRWLSSPSLDCFYLPVAEQRKTNEEEDVCLITNHRQNLDWKIEAPARKSSTLTLTLAPFYLITHLPMRRGWLIQGATTCVSSTFLRAI